MATNFVKAVLLLTGFIKEQLMTWFLTKSLSTLVLLKHRVQKFKYQWNKKKKSSCNNYGILGLWLQACSQSSKRNISKLYGLQSRQNTQASFAKSLDSSTSQILEAPYSILENYHSNDLH